MAAQRDTERPIADGELEGLFGSLAGYGCLVLAVSGGADSTALMHLIARWLGRVPAGHLRPRCVVATVDHGLRDASADEARTVAGAAQALGLSHVTLAIQGLKSATGVQAAARQARYKLLFSQARDLGAGPVALLTAHTRDDQAETVLMRLKRGSGVDGLAGISPYIHHQGVDLIRPLLAVPKSQLVATLVSAGIAWTQDPSNENQRFERVQLRKHLAARAALGLTDEALARTAGRARRASDLLTQLVGPAFGDTSLALRFGFEEEPRFLSTASVAWPGELRLRRLRAVIEAVGGEGGAVNLSQVEDLMDNIVTAKFNAATLGRCRIVKVKHRSALSVFGDQLALLQPPSLPGERMAPTLVIAREIERGPVAGLTLQPGDSATFDGRFEIALSQACQGPAHVRPLDAHALAALADGTQKPSWWAAVPASLRFLLASQPAVWLGEQLVSVPTLEPSPLATVRFVGHAKVHKQSDFEPDA